MDLFLACERGCAGFVSKELSLRGIKGTVQEFDNCVTVEGLSEQDMILAAYTLQTPTFIGRLLAASKISVGFEDTLIELSAIAGTLPLKELFVKDKSFTVTCHREGTHEYNSVDVSQELGRTLKSVVNEELGFVPMVDLKKPQMKIHVHVEEEFAWVSLDLVGKDVSKRSFKVFNNPHSMKGPVAASLLMAAGWEPGMTLLDPFAADGIIAIEAALMGTHTSLHFYDKKLSLWPSAKAAELLEAFDAKREDQEMHEISSFDAQLRNVTAAKKNAKIAGVDKSINFSKLDIEWIDTKLGSKTVDCIVTRPVETSKHIAAAKAQKIQKDLFYQADYVLKKGGNITFLCHRPEDLLPIAEQYKFKHLSQHLIHTGQLPLWIATYSR